MRSTTGALVAGVRRFYHGLLHIQGRNSSSSSALLLLKAAQGFSGHTRHLRRFPLRADEVVDSPETPSDFHRLLCQLIRNAKRQVQLASLYVGTASSDQANTELELLHALEHASSKNVSVQILLDASRALRPVSTQSDPNKTITSAQVCFDALSSSPFSPSPHNGGVYLLPVLPPLFQRRLPNPWNEIAGVFHIKAYVIDDEVLLSGANLSHEYFTTRIDRYLHLRCEDLVAFYSKLISLLCERGSIRYIPQEDSALRRHSSMATVNSRIQRKKLQESLEVLFTEDAADSGIELKDGRDDNEIVAYAVPTFQAPRRYFAAPSSVLDHERTLRNLLKEAAAAAAASASSASTASVATRENSVLTSRIATAYLNPTRVFLETLARSCTTHFLTAGRISHGFAPKDNNSNSTDFSRDWTIPNVFVYAAQQVTAKIQQLQTPAPSSSSQHSQTETVAFYHRPGWTFHAKGLWLSVDDVDSASSLKLSHNSSKLLAVTHGSGNFGERSAGRDMESNLILILSSPQCRLALQHVDEWNRLCDFAKEEPEEPPPIWIPFVFPWIRTFF